MTFSFAARCAETGMFGMAVFPLRLPCRRGALMCGQVSVP